MEINHALDKSNVRSALFFASNYLRRPFQLFSKHLLEHLQNKHFEFVMNVQIATRQCEEYVNQLNREITTCGAPSINARLLKDIFPLVMRSVIELADYGI